MHILFTLAIGLISLALTIPIIARTGIVGETQNSGTLRRDSETNDFAFGPVEIAGQTNIADNALMVPYYTGRIYPTPQQATYSERFAPLAETALRLGQDLKQDDPRILVLLDRISRHGGKVVFVKSAAESRGTLICLGDTEADQAYLGSATVPERPEGYLIHSAQKDGRNVIILKGRDKPGLLWAIVSLNQLITRRDSQPVVQMAEVADYPAIARRGGLMTAMYPLMLRYIIGSKMNMVVVINAFTYRTDPFREMCDVWRTNNIPTRTREHLKMIGATLTPLGIDWYASLNPQDVVDRKHQFRCKNEADFHALFRHIALVAENGGNFSLQFDDNRFPMHPDDVKDFGCAREADIFLVNRLNNALKEIYPKRRILFIPPFYWGPDSPSKYPESREEYLRALGERLPPEIGIFWTGPRVKSGKITGTQVQWITDLIKRKPLFWQNTKDSPHVLWYHYLTDPLKAWPDWHYDGFFQDVEVYLLGAHTPGDNVALWTLTDYLWNPKAYDPERSVEEAAKHLFGPESFEALKELNKSLSYFDTYGRRVTPAAARNIQAIQQAMAAVDAAWKQALAFHPDAVKRLSNMARYIDMQKEFVAQVKANKGLALFSQSAEEERKRAEKEVKLDDKADTFLTAYDFLGGHPAASYAVRCEKRLAMWIYGKRSMYPAMKASFECDPFPPAGDYVMIVSAQDDDAEASCRIRILINATKIFEGAGNFPRYGWARQTFNVPAAGLQRNNTLTIENIEDSDSSSAPPFFMLNYVVLRKTVP